MREKPCKAYVAKGIMTVEDTPYMDKCMIFIDKDGNWLHNNRPIIHEQILRLFHENLQRDSRGRYCIVWRGQICEVDVEDVPFVVRRVDLRKADRGSRATIIIHLNDHTEERLDYSSLRIGGENVLYCGVKNGKFEARFSRPAYYQFAELLEFNQEKGEFYLLLNGRRLILPKLI